LYDLDDNLLLAVFPYLETSEVLNVSQVCRYMLQKIYLLFGMEMSLIVPEWGVRPDRAALLEAQTQAQTQEEQRKKQGTPAIAAAAVTAQAQAPSAQITAQIAAQITAPAPASAFAPASASAPTPEPVMLTKEIADSLTKKLNGKIRAGPGLLH
jgi:hypothetical protein